MTHKSFFSNNLYFLDFYIPSLYNITIKKLLAILLAKNTVEKVMKAIIYAWISLQ